MPYPFPEGARIPPQKIEKADFIKSNRTVYLKVI